MNDNILTNCPKCGNPLTPGTKSCPVCGTPLEIQNAVPNQSGVTVNQSTPVQAVQPAIQPVTPPPIQTGAVSEIAPSIQTPPQETVIPSISSPSTPGVANNSIPSVPSPSIPSVPNSGNPTLTPGIVQSESTTKKNKPKLKLNKTLILVLVIVLVASLAFIFLKGNNKGNKKVVKTTPVAEEVVTKDVVANGYSFKIEQDWKVQSNIDNTVITNSNENVIIKLENYSFDLSSLSKDMLKSRFIDISSEFNPNKVEISDVDITETKISSKDAYIVNAVVTEDDGKKYATQYYFINGGASLVVGASIVYTNDEAKTNYEGKVTTLLNNLSFVTDSSWIISTLNKSSKAFSVYFSAVNGVTLNIPSENPEIPSGEETNPGEVTGENQDINNQIVDNQGGENQVNDPTIG